jgi:signal transduction histidine kinase
VTYLFYVRLIGLTAGTLVYLFLLALILGHRRPRLFERLLFFLILSLFLIYAGALLRVNAEIQYGVVPESTQILYKFLIALGILFVFPLAVQVHLEYLRLVRRAKLSKWTSVLAYALYLLPVTLVATSANASRIHAWGLSQILSSLSLNTGWLWASIVAAALFEIGAAITARERTERLLFWSLCTSSLVILLLWTNFVVPIEWVQVAGALPGAVLIYFALKHNFLEYGAQRNLVYALSATFLALLYLAFVHRISGWLEPMLPPEATASVLLFVLIFLFEPLERVIGPALHRRFQERVGRLQQLSTELQTEARNGNIAELIAFAERRIREEFGLGLVRISVPRDPSLAALESPGGLGHVARLPLMKNGSEIGLLEAATTGSYLTGETSAALEFLAEQLPGSIDLCRMIGEKLQLERELAERERMAGLGQMAATISHNLRNPLSSMKTVLQVQLENPDLPVDARRDCTLVVSEIDRMSAKLTQLLRYAKPSVNGERVAAVALARQTASLFGRDAERRNIRMEFRSAAG